MQVYVYTANVVKNEVKGETLENALIHNGIVTVRNNNEIAVVANEEDLGTIVFDDEVQTAKMVTFKKRSRSGFLKEARDLALTQLEIRLKELTEIVGVLKAYNESEE